ncbi:hypothetical protein BV20DRAFT_811860 [Pilatotrama ljubarskyi]|nr:hypothetical protein BV20DRAFT_811860 [Pilatotrama ljubarskyi]
MSAPHLDVAASSRAPSDRLLLLGAKPPLSRPDGACQAAPARSPGRLVRKTRACRTAASLVFWHPHACSDFPSLRDWRLVWRLAEDPARGRHGAVGRTQTASPSPTCLRAVPRRTTNGAEARRRTFSVHSTGAGAPTWRNLETSRAPSHPRLVAGRTDASRNFAHRPCTCMQHVARSEPVWPAAAAAVGASREGFRAAYVRVLNMKCDDLRASTSTSTRRVHDLAPHSRVNCVNCVHALREADGRMRTHPPPPAHPGSGDSESQRESCRHVARAQLQKRVACSGR